MLAKGINDNACLLDKRDDHEHFASTLALTKALNSITLSGAFLLGRAGAWLRARR